MSDALERTNDDVPCAGCGEPIPGVYPFVGADEEARHVECLPDEKPSPAALGNELQRRLARSAAAKKGHETRRRRAAEQRELDGAA